MLATTEGAQIPTSLHDRTVLRDNLASALCMSGDPTLASLGQEIRRRPRTERGAPPGLGPRTTSSSSVVIGGQECLVIVDVKLVPRSAPEYTPRPPLAQQGALPGSSPRISTTMLSLIQVDEQVWRIIVNIQPTSQLARPPNSLNTTHHPTQPNRARTDALNHINNTRNGSWGLSWRRRAAEYVAGWF